MTLFAATNLAPRRSHVWLDAPLGSSLLASEWPTSLGPMRGVIATWSDAAGSHSALAQLDWLDRPGLTTNLARLMRTLRVTHEPQHAAHPLLACVQAIAEAACADAPPHADPRAHPLDDSAPLPLLRLGTPFQHAAWCALLDIPAGCTRTYAQQARAMGVPRSVRAVAAANGQNFRSIVIPCHRVIGSDGTLTGYGGGIERKRALLERERDAVMR